MKVLLTTLHAKYVHASLALPCLAAACRDQAETKAVIREFTVNEPPDQVLRRIVAEDADVVAFSTYIWNIGQTLRIASDLKKIRPATFIIIGGPEASYGFFDLLAANPAIDCIIRGEGEESFRELLAALAALPQGIAPEQALHDIPGIVFSSNGDIVATPARTPISNLDWIPSPFALGLVDLAKPLVYCETSRGCPFSCAFCMSSLEKGVRSFSPQRIEADLGLLMEAEVKTVKLVDRTFNFDARRAGDIWEFILRHNRASTFHFEIAADLLTDENITLLRRVPEGVFRFEIGIQSGAADTLSRVERKSDLARLFANVRRLREETGVTLHLDLVAGLPGEDLSGFLESLQRLIDARPHHIQVEPLKVLKGSPMRKIAADEGYAFADAPPYKILRTPELSFVEIGRIETIARLLDLYGNSGRFSTTLTALSRTAPLSRVYDAFAAFWEEEDPPQHYSLAALFEILWRFACSYTEKEGQPTIGEALSYDYCSADFPVQGKLPSFFATTSAVPPRSGREPAANLAGRLGLPEGSRIRTFARRFSRDYRQLPWQERETGLLFVYASAQGRGLQVRVISPEEADFQPET